MSDETQLKAALSRQLFTDSALRSYAILDGASIPGLLQVFAEHDPRRVCLFRGELAPDLAMMAPYLVELLPQTPFADFVLGGWGRHWGVFVLSEAAIRDLRKHFRTFLMVRDPNGKPLYFRYYDPRVLRVYLPTCNAEEAAGVFGPVGFYLAEGEDPGTLLRFWAERGEVKQSRSKLAMEAETGT